LRIAQIVFSPRNLVKEVLCVAQTWSALLLPETFSQPAFLDQPGTAGFLVDSKIAIKTDIKSFPHCDFSFIIVRAFQNAAQHSSSSVAGYGRAENKLFEI
jgi:hypothetical protein